MTSADLLNDRVERTIGADVRLLYGLGVPMLAATGFIIAYALSGSWVLLGLVVLFAFLAAGVVVGILQMLREGDTPDATPTDGPAVDPKGGIRSAAPDFGRSGAVDR